MQKAFRRTFSRMGSALFALLVRMPHRANNWGYNEGFVCFLNVHKRRMDTVPSAKRLFDECSASQYKRLGQCNFFRVTHYVFHFLITRVCVCVECEVNQVFFCVCYFFSIIAFVDVISLEERWKLVKRVDYVFYEWKIVFEVEFLKGFVLSGNGKNRKYVYYIKRVFIQIIIIFFNSWKYKLKNKAFSITLKIEHFSHLKKLLSS